MAVTSVIAWVIFDTLRERKRQRQLSQTRSSLDEAGFTGQLVEAGVAPNIAEFVWERFQPYYFAPLTPYPNDRPIGDMRIDGDDLSDIVTDSEKQFDRRWTGKGSGQTILHCSSSRWLSSIRRLISEELSNRRIAPEC